MFFVKSFVGTGQLVVWVTYLLPAHGVIAPVRFTPGWYIGLFHLFSDRIIGSVVETKLHHVLLRFIKAIITDIFKGIQMRLKQQQVRDSNRNLLRDHGHRRSSAIDEVSQGPNCN